MAGVVLLAVGGVLAWENLGPGRPCESEHSVTNEYGDGVKTHPTVEAALIRFGRYPGIRGSLPPRSLRPTAEDAPEFGATIDPDAHPDTEGGRGYELWKDGDLVQSVTLDRFQGGWVIAGYSGCSPIP